MFIGVLFISKKRSLHLGRFLAVEAFLCPSSVLFFAVTSHVSVVLVPVVSRGVAHTAGIGLVLCMFGVDVHFHGSFACGVELSTDGASQDLVASVLFHVLPKAVLVLQLDMTSRKLALDG